MMGNSVKNTLMDEVGKKQEASILWSDIHIITTKSTGLLASGIESWFAISGRFDNVYIGDFDSLRNKSYDTLSYRNALFLILKIQDSDGFVLNHLKAASNRFLEMPFLVVDYDEMDIESIKEILLLPNTGIITSDASVSDVFVYLEFLKRNGWVMGNKIKEKLLQQPSVDSKEYPRYNIERESFNVIENSILKAAIKGLNIKQTANEIGLSHNTVAVYRSRLLKRTGIPSMNKLLLLLRQKEDQV